MNYIESFFNISINNDKKRKTFLVNFFSFVALLSLLFFGITGLIAGNTSYSIYIFTFWFITLLNLFFLKFSKKVNTAAHVIIFLMFIFGLILFSFLGVGTSGLFWLYTVPALTISLTNYKQGSIYSVLFLIIIMILYFTKPEFVTTVYPKKIILRFIISYIVLNVLIIIFEFSRKKTQDELYKTFSKLKETNEELKASEEELRANNEGLYSLNEELSDNQKRLNLAQKIGGIGVWEWFVENNIITWSDTAYEIFGAKKTTKKLSSSDYFKFVHEDDKKRLIEELNISLKNNVKIHKTEYRIIKNNSIRNIEETSELIKNKQGRLIKMIGVLQDVTEKRKTETEIKEKNEELSAISEELKQNNEELLTAKEEIERQNQLLKRTLKKYDLISNSISDLIWMLSFDLKPLYISNSCKKFIGYTKEELKNLALEDFHTPASYKRIKKLLKNTIDLKNNPKGAKEVKTEIEYIHKNGEIIIAEVMGYLIFDDNDNAVAIGGISRNITKRKKAELQLAESNKKIAVAHKDILDNIKYAKTIQDGLLTKKDFIDNLFNEYFLIYKQRFSVGGDFYYINQVNNYIIFAVGDCTGHGVSGGLLSMIAITYLHEIIRKENIKTTGATLNIVRQRFKRIFGDKHLSGFNIALCAVDTKTNILLYSGAYNPVIIIRKNELIELKATRNPIGHHFKEINFATNKIELKKNDKIYLFSDGYYDQINPIGKKIGKKQFKNNIKEFSSLSFSEQKKKHCDFLTEWKKDQEQIDDITFLGINWEY